MSNNDEYVVLLDPKSGRALVKNGVTIALFLNRRIFECSAQLTAALDLSMRTIPADALAWAVVSATSEHWQPLDAAAFKRMRDALAVEGARKRKLTGFRINDAGPDAPQHGFRVLDKDKDPAYPDSRTLVQITLPPTWLDAERVEELVHFVQELAALLEPGYGYCSPALLTADAAQPLAFATLKGTAVRYPGYDVDMNVMSCLHIGDRVRGARWLTLLGPALLARLAAATGEAIHVPDDLAQQAIGPSLLLRAGKLPELGDVNRNIDTPLLRSMARLLEPVTLFEEIDLLSYFAGFDEDFLRRWERRFLDPRP